MSKLKMHWQIMLFLVAAPKLRNNLPRICVMREILINIKDLSFKTCFYLDFILRNTYT